MSATPKIPKTLSNAVLFHQKGITGKNITIAILDSGLDLHPDFSRQSILAFKDFIYQNPYPYDDYSHGTHVTGIIISNKLGIAPSANIVSLKVLDRNGNTTIETMINGIQWILEHHQEYHIRIVNISIGGKGATISAKEQLLNEWVTRLWDEGLIVCCSAGNKGPKPNTITAPGNCHSVITVGSSDGQYFSSAGPLQAKITKPELVAPGLHILSTKPGNGYEIKNGTSMSVPFISSYCALLLQKEPTLTNNEVKQRLLNAARTLPYLPYNMQGAGSVQLSKLLI